jgi:hypothetical protein
MNAFFAVLNAGEIGTKMFMALVDFRVRAPSSNEILAKQMQTCKTLFSSKSFSQSLTGGVVGQRKSGLCKHQKKHHGAVLKEKLTSHLT